MSIYRTRVTVRPANQGDHPNLVKFISREPYVHRHLDWRAPLEWLGSEPFLIAEQEGIIQGVLACPPDPEHIHWIRLFGATTGVHHGQVFDLLLETAREMLPHPGQDRIVAIAIQDWFDQLLVEAGFAHPQNIVVLEWMGRLPPERSKPEDILIRKMSRTDLDQVYRVDTASFAPLWQHSLDGLTLAYDQASYSTVAETAEGIVGYQISTSMHMSAHLARLAVVPELQGRHIGYAIVRDLLSHFHRKGAWRVTVNTQSDNHQSLALYERIGFRRTGEEFPVFELEGEGKPG